VRQLFKLAREKKPAIIFIDEIDALCGHSGMGADGGEHTVRMKTEFLVQLDGVGNDNKGVLVLAATNLPWALDPALRRRFQKRIYIPLPNEPARRQLFKIHSGELGNDFSHFDIARLAQATEGFSGSDIANVVQAALNAPLKLMRSTKHFKKVSTKPAHWKKRVPELTLLDRGCRR